MLVVATLVAIATHLGTVVVALPLYVEHLVRVISVHDPVAADAPELLAIARLPLARVQTVTCSIKEMKAAITNSQCQSINQSINQYVHLYSAE